MDKRVAVRICLALFALTLGAFSPVAQHDFLHFDDATYVTANPHVLHGLTCADFAWAWKSVYASNWHPLAWLAHMLDCQLFGLNPAGHHLTSLVLHVLNTLLLFLVLSGMTRELWRPALVAALFGVHPLHVESVAWVAERKDLLSTLDELARQISQTFSKVGSADK